jgi:protein-S-isoprenylcysteine O-methyltransferase Ste14
LYHYAILAWFALAGIVFLALFFITAPYGRHGGETRGPKIPSWLGWVLMESPSVFAFIICYAIGHRTLVAWIFFALWQMHYVHRSFIFPFRMRGAQKPMPLLICASAFSFTAVNGYLNARWLTALGPVHTIAWLVDPRFLVGVALFVLGFAINQHSDHVLIHLRAPGETGYKIPRGGFYRWVSCPNYLGELLEWSGWAIATWSPAGLAFALWTAANLVPRARAHHQWYRQQFPDYPTERRAILPLLY